MERPGGEPIVAAMKPLDGTFAANARRHGVAGLHIDGGRIATGEAVQAAAGVYGFKDERGGAYEKGTGRTYRDTLSGGNSTGHVKHRNDGWNRPWMESPEQVADRAARARENVEKAEAMGRWPTNVLFEHHAECQEVGTTRVSSTGGHVRPFQLRRSLGTFEENTGRVAFNYADADGKEEVADWRCHADCPVGGLNEQAGKLSIGPMEPKFDQANHARTSGPFASMNQVAGKGQFSAHRYASRFFYCAKASTRERDAGLEWEQDEWPGEVLGGLGQPRSRLGDRRVEVFNFHPTVKPVKVLEYLCRLTETPTGGVVLDPFMGSGSTGVACARAGRRFVGIEIDPASFELARARLANSGDEHVAQSRCREMERAAEPQLELWGGDH